MKVIVSILAATGILILAGCQQNSSSPSTSSSTPDTNTTVAQPVESYSNAPTSGATATNVPATTNTP